MSGIITVTYHTLQQTAVNAAQDSKMISITWISHVSEMYWFTRRDHVTV